jgi:hypothetical protein
MALHSLAIVLHTPMGQLLARRTNLEVAFGIIDKLLRVELRPHAASLPALPAPGRVPGILERSSPHQVHSAFIHLYHRGPAHLSVVHDRLSGHHTRLSPHLIHPRFQLPLIIARTK